MAFGVELDSFCERETAPEFASLDNVGMRSLSTSKLYGNSAAVVAACVQPTGCTGTCTLDPALGCTTGSAACCNATVPVPAGNGPGKSNMIGFTSETCPATVTLGTIIRSDTATGGALPSGYRELCIRGN